jgi:1-deoxy-D-xylulose-5-phosphate reductoisomerase
MKRIVLLGSTGSIGRNTLEVVSRHAGEFEIVGLAARRNHEALAAQCAAHAGAMLALTADAELEALTRTHPHLASRTVGPGEHALEELIERAAPDIVLNALVGVVGLRPTMAALAAGIPVAIANKETIVTGGELLLATARKAGSQLIPIDSEHVAISQCVGTEPMEAVERIVITASGGSLRDRPLDSLADVTVEEVLNHPTWDMGDKVTVDSATLMNKGLEVIEAHWLFDMPYRKIDAVIHPQSIVHSLVEFVDGSIIAQMGEPDMRYPILYALSYPQRWASPLRSRITDFPDLSFQELDPKRYPCFVLAREAAEAGGTAPAVLNAANEVAVGAFLAGELLFGRIPEVIGGALAAVPRREVTSLEDVLAADAEARQWILANHELKSTGSGSVKQEG